MTTAAYTAEEIAAVLDEAHALEAEITAVMAEVSAALKVYGPTNIYPDHCDALLTAIDSSNFDYQVKIRRNRHSSTSTPIAKWRQCNAKNRRAIARVRKELAALLKHPDYGYYHDMNGNRYTVAEAQAEYDAALAKHQPAPALTPTTAPAIVKRVGEYDPTTGQYPAFVSIDGKSEQCIGARWTAGAADRACDEYIFNYYVDHHTPEAAAQIAAAFEPTPSEAEAAHRTRADELQAILDADRVDDSLHQQLRDLIERWRIEDDPPSAGRALQRQLCRDYCGALRRFFRLSEADQRLLTGAYITYWNANRTVEGQIVAWRKSLAQIEVDGVAEWSPGFTATEARHCMNTTGTSGRDHGPLH